MLILTSTSNDISTERSPSSGRVKSWRRTIYATSPSVNAIDKEKNERRERKRKQAQAFGFAIVKTP